MPRNRKVRMQFWRSSVPGSADIVSSGNPAEDKAALTGFAQAYQVMNRWRKLGDGSEVLLVGADNQAFPIPLMKNAAGQWYFDGPPEKRKSWRVA